MDEKKPRGNKKGRIFYILLVLVLLGLLTARVQYLTKLPCVVMALYIFLKIFYKILPLFIPLFFLVHTSEVKNRNVQYIFFSTVF